MESTADQASCTVMCDGPAGLHRSKGRRAEMADRKKPHDGSGEDANRPEHGAGGLHRSQAGDVIDAEYETLIPEPAGGRPQRPADAFTSAPALSGMDTLRAGGARPPAPRQRGGPLFWVTGVAVAAAAFWVSGGHAVVRGTSYFAERVAVQGLAIAGVTSRVDASGARPILFVDGEAANEGAATESLPPLDVVVTGNDGRSIRYRLGTSGRPLAPGERFAFSSRLDVPKNGVRTVTVTFGE